MRYKRCYYYATKADHKDLVDFISTLGLTVLPAFIGDRPKLGYDDWLIEKTLRYLTYKDAKDVITHRSKYDKPQRDYYNHAGDVLIQWKLGYLNESKQYLVTGIFEWIVLDQYSQNDVHTADASKEIGKYWRKIDRWVKKNWVDPLGNNEDFFGPEAAKLHDQGYDGGSHDPDDVFPSLDIVYVDEDKGESRVVTTKSWKIFDFLTKRK